MNTWKDLIKYNVDFLTGKRNKTFYHEVLVDETIPLLGKLVNINKHGLFTYEGQPNSHVKGFVKKTWINEKDEKQGNWYYEVIQKSYILFIAENNEITKKLKIYLKNHPDIYVLWVNGNTESMYKNKFYSNFPRRKNNVTKQRHRKKGEDEWSKWDYYTNIWSTNDKKDYEIFEDYLLLRDGIKFQIAMKKYGSEESVEDILLEFYER